MSRRRLRFIHSGDWHLESPLGGLSNVPERLWGPFLDAPYRAAERVVTAALGEQADFVVLAGDIIDVELAGPHGIDFLRRQFTRLAEKHIPVYWSGGRVDRPERWPAALPLPEIVHRFSSRRPQDFVFETADGPQARLTGLSRPRGGKIRAADFWPDPDGLPTIAIAHGRADRASLAARGLTYWALGGKHRRTTLLESPRGAEYCGSPQARDAAETGSSSCTVVEIDEDGTVHARPVSTDVVRWHTRRVVVGEATTPEALEGILIEQLNDLHRGSPDLHLLVSWSVHGTGPLVAALRRGKRAGEILGRLRRRYEADNPVVWPLGLEVEPEAAVPPAWLEQDSLVGDYLRSLAQFDGRHETAAADLVGPLRELAGRHPGASELECLIGLSDAERRKVLQKAAALGADLLMCEEA